MLDDSYCTRSELVSRLRAVVEVIESREETIVDSRDIMDIAGALDAHVSEDNCGDVVFYTSYHLDREFRIKRKSTWQTPASVDPSPDPAT